MDDKEKINEGDWVNCYICEQVFKRKRETKRYCNDCKRGFCEGEHGTFEGGKVAYCVKCRSLKK